MSLLDYFKPVSTWSVPKVRKFMHDKNPDEYNLVDVRQPKEYEKEHLPGAILMPMKEIEQRLREIDPSKPTLVY